MIKFKFLEYIKNLILITIILTAIVYFLLLNVRCTDRSSNGNTASAEILVPDTLLWSVRMAESEIYRRGDSLEYGKSDPKAKWNYQTGLFLKALLDLWHQTHIQKYYDYSQRVVDSYVEDDGTIKTYKMEDFNIDKINSGKVLLTLYNISKNEKYKKSADILHQQLNDHPRTREGGYWHKKRYPWQMWLDGIYMASPFYAEYSLMFNQTAGFDDVIKQILLIDMHTRDSNTGLRYHAWDESNNQKWSNPVTGCSPHFWGRAMGWYAMALVDVLDFLPLDHPKREQIIFILKDLSKPIAKYQDKNSGLWYQVIDLGGREGNYLEASASSMFVYSLAKAVYKGYIDSSNLEVAKLAYNGLLNNLIKTESNGLVNLTQICSVGGLGGDPYRDGSFEYYMSEPVVTNDLKGVGPFIMASLQMEKMTE